MLYCNVLHYMRMLQFHRYKKLNVIKPKIKHFVYQIRPLTKLKVKYLPTKLPSYVVREEEYYLTKIK